MFKKENGGVHGIKEGSDMDFFFLAVANGSGNIQHTGFRHLCFSKSRMMDRSSVLSLIPLVAPYGIAAREIPFKPGLFLSGIMLKETSGVQTVHSKMHCLYNTVLQFPVFIQEDLYVTLSRHRLKQQNSWNK